MRDLGREDEAHFAIETAVEGHYATIQLDRDIVAATKIEIGAQLAAARATAEGDAELQRRRIRQLTAERGKLLQAHYADAVRLDLLKSEQARIAREVTDAEHLLAVAITNFDDVDAVITKALELAGNSHTAYLAANPPSRRKFNQSFFTKSGSAAAATSNEPNSQNRSKPSTPTPTRQGLGPSPHLGTDHYRPRRQATNAPLPPSVPISTLWCGRGDLNPHILSDTGT